MTFPMPGVEWNNLYLDKLNVMEAAWSSSVILKFLALWRLQELSWHWAGGWGRCLCSGFLLMFSLPFGCSDFKLLMKWMAKVFFSIKTQFQQMVNGGGGRGRKHKWSSLKYQACFLQKIELPNRKTTSSHWDPSRWVFFILTSSVRVQLWAG